MAAHRRRLPLPVPTDHLPGSLGKILVLAERLARGEWLYHPLDARLDQDGLGITGDDRSEQGADPKRKIVVSDHVAMHEPIPGF